MFVDSRSRVDREGLRLYVLEQLKEMRITADRLCVDKSSFWEKVTANARQSLFGEEKEKTLKAIQQLLGLPKFISMWVDTAVDTSERFEFFVLSKAQEMKSGDQAKDYYWALQVRHDQLVALVRVLELLLDKIKLWTTLRPAALFDDPVFAGLTDYGVEDQIYMEAERVYRERQQVTEA